MNILRFLEPECIELDLKLPSDQSDQSDQDEAALASSKNLRKEKEAVLEQLSFVLERGGKVLNRTKLFKDLLQRESQMTTAVAPGIALPHARSMQARSFTMAFARVAEPGVYFESLDGTPTRIFLALACPPWDDKIFLKVYRDFAEMIQNEWVVDALLAAKTQQDVLSVLRGYVTS